MSGTRGRFPAAGAKLVRLQVLAFNSPKPWQGHPSFAEISGMAALGLVGIQKSHPLCVKVVTGNIYKPE